MVRPIRLHRNSLPCHIHHIKHWAVYKSHDADDMIAICPSCHDNVHHGRLEITDEVLYRWKGIHRPSAPDSALLYVEPAAQLKMLAGSIALSTASDQVAVFELSNTNRLSLRVLDGDILQTTCRLQNLKGKEILRVVENYVRVARDPDVKFDFQAGHARVTVPASDTYIPEWVVQQMRHLVPSFASIGHIVALDIEVLRPGLLKVQGFWPADEGCVVITPEALSFCRIGQLRPLSLCGQGEDSVLMWAGPIDRRMFELFK